MWKCNGFIYGLTVKWNQAGYHVEKAQKKQCHWWEWNSGSSSCWEGLKCYFFSCSFWFLKWNIQCHVLCSCSPKVTESSGCVDVGLHIGALFRGSRRWCNLCCSLGQYWGLAWNSLYSATSSVNCFCFSLPCLFLWSTPRAQDKLFLVW